ncbi:hypothetical protein BGLA2_2170022 [Burkholderia gladioli]|nr:hypothetical protein BGLA2_2170022 [Burkholderia gladioli]
MPRSAAPRLDRGALVRILLEPTRFPRAFVAPPASRHRGTGGAATAYQDDNPARAIVVFTAAARRVDPLRQTSSISRRPACRSIDGSSGGRCASPASGRWGSPAAACR